MTNKIKQSLAGGGPLSLGERRSQEEYELSKNFKYAKILSKKRFKIQLIKQNNKKTELKSSPRERYSRASHNIGSVGFMPKHTFSDFKLKKKKVICDYDALGSDIKISKKNRVLSPIIMKSK